MAFWKRSEDPWDFDPEKRKNREPVTYETENEPEEKPEWKLPWQKKEPAPVVEEPLLPCPWCGKQMKKGYLIAGGKLIQWTETKPMPVLGNFFDEAVNVSDEGVLSYYKTSYFCGTCRKLVADVPEPPADEFTQWTRPEKESEENDT